MSRSTAIPSASAWKFSTTRWRRTASATVRTSSRSGTERPSIAARAFAPHDPLWLEEPTIPEDVAGHARILREGGLPVAAGSKRRLGDDRVVIDSIVGDVEGKRAIVLDDEIATGGSIVELLDRLADRGVTEAAVACTHGLFAGRAVERLRGHPMISEVVTTDTVPAPADWPELKVRSVAGLFAEAIKRIHEGESVSSLFDGVDPTHAPPRQRSLFDRVRS